ncbi:MAG: hypothetical protein BroJett040_11510 [Oligoflexia bacterium]|nr:MAG: hypothetical protein BroJett040_11510 [Oligoflexia bacterium]
MNKSTVSFQVNTPFGPLSFHGTKSGLLRVSFDVCLRSKTLPLWAKQTETYFQSFFDNKVYRGPSPTIPLLVESLTDFQKMVYEKLSQTKPGETLSYGDLGNKCGAKNAARAVGTTMRKNRFPIIIPCHRVLPQSGRIGNYSAANGSKTKQSLLDFESKFSKSHRHMASLSYRVKFLTKSE